MARNSRQCLPRCFNTQPPEGGWISFQCLLFVWPLFQHTAARRRLGLNMHYLPPKLSFNTQPPEGGWVYEELVAEEQELVSTHSRPKAAGKMLGGNSQATQVSTHSRPKAAG